MSNTKAMNETSETETIVTTFGFDVRAMVKIFADNVTSVQNRISNLNPDNAEEIRESVRELWVYSVEVSKLANALQSEFDKTLKLGYELEILNPNTVKLVRTPNPIGRGRPEMTAAERQPRTFLPRSKRVWRRGLRS
jgi:hypothetical protein